MKLRVFALVGLLFISSAESFAANAFSVLGHLGYFLIPPREILRLVTPQMARGPASDSYSQEGLDQRLIFSRDFFLVHPLRLDLRLSLWSGRNPASAVEIDRIPVTRVDVLRVTDMVFEFKGDLL